MRAASWMIPLLLVGCARRDVAPAPVTQPDPVDGDDSADSVAEETSPPVDVANLHGTAPSTALPAPEFRARNFDATARGREDLLGRPHVLWFFPASGTPG